MPLAADEQPRLRHEPRCGRRQSVETVLAVGDPREMILEMAKSRDVDAIVMGTHGRRGIAHALLGSVSERIVRVSRIPVVTVHRG